MPHEHEVPGFKLGTLLAGADLSAKQFYAVKLDSNSKLVLSGAGESIAGVLQGKPAADESAEVMVDGVTKAVAGAAFAAGVKLTPDANGKLITATIGDFICGHAIGTSSADGDIVAVLLKPEGVSP